MADAEPEPTAPEPAEPEPVGPVPEDAAQRAAGLGVSLAGVDAFHVPLKRPPRAGLVFDVGTGEVLWRHNPQRRLPIASLTRS